MQLLVQSCLHPSHAWSHATEIFSVPNRRLFPLPEIARYRKTSQNEKYTFFLFKKHNRYIDKRYRKQGKGKFSQGKGGTKTCDDSTSSIGSCVRASVTEARVTVYVCVHMPRDCVCERKDVHAYCSKMLAAQQKQDYALAELWGGGGGLCKVESLKSAEIK